MKKALKEFFETAIVIGAAGSIAYGSWLAWRPAGFIVGGVLILGLAIIGKLT